MSATSLVTLQAILAGVYNYVLMRLYFLLQIQVAGMYSWPDIAGRTVQVYNQVAGGCLHDLQQQRCEEQRASVAVDESCKLLNRLARYRRCGFVTSMLFGALALAVHLWWCLLRWQQPACRVQVALDFGKESCVDKKRSEKAQVGVQIDNLKPMLVEELP
jgi:hypothetical protein